MASDDPGTRFYPSNGTEGMDFQKRWCDRCTRDNGFDEEGEPLGKLCLILAASLLEPVGEWVWGPDGEPVCTAFVLREEAKPYRCSETLDLFDAR